MDTPNSILELTKKLVEYRKTILPSDDNNENEGIRILLGEIDRHYYINLRARFDPERPSDIIRDMWMYFPYSHLSSNGTGWPPISILKSLYSCDDLNAFNIKNEKEKSYGFPFNRTGITFKAIAALNDRFYEPLQFVSFNRDVYQPKLQKLFGPLATCPDGYDPFLYGVEKSIIYDSLPDDKLWIYFPLCFSGLFVTMLAARIPNQGIQGVAEVLPIFGSVVCEKVLFRYAQYGKSSPLLAVTKEDHALTLLSTVAAQCGLNDVKYEEGVIRFFPRDKTRDIADEPNLTVMESNWPIRIGRKQVEFQFPEDNTEEWDWSVRKDYLKILLRTVKPILARFNERGEQRQAFARAAIMSRNFSHNVGSHSLANPNLHRSLGIDLVRSLGIDLVKLNGQKESDKKALDRVQTNIEQRLSTFHAYAQGRLDFLARAISGSGYRPEPLFFLNDVLEAGFFRQGVLLDTLIEDLGFPANNIEFHVSIQKANKSSVAGQGPDKSAEFGVAIYTWNESEHRFVRKTDLDIEDAVVGIPGGIIGTHALHAFLENTMRNAAKYRGGPAGRHSREPGKKLRLYLRLELCQRLCNERPVDSAWVLSVWNNLSHDNNGLVSRQIRSHINEPLVNPETGEMSAQGHGIQEMKLCAELLSGGENGLRFPADDGYDQNNLRCTDCAKSCTASKEYALYKNSNSGKNIREFQPLRCYSAPHPSNGDDVVQDQTKWLTYNLFIPIPILLAVVSPACANGENTGLPANVRYYGTVEELAKNGAHIGILLDDGRLDMGKALDEVARLHPCLPFRLMVVTQENEENDAWARKLKEKRTSDGQPFKYPNHIPDRRLHICGGKAGRALKKVLADPSSTENLKYLGAGGANEKRWEAIVLRVYDAWLRVYKSLPAAANGFWKLCIGFEHGGEKVANRWKDRLTAFTAGDDPCVGVHVVSKASKEDTNPTRFFSDNWKALVHK